MELRLLVLQLSLLITTQQLLSSTVNGLAAPPGEKACSYSHSLKLSKVSCNDMKLTEVPQYLRSSVEVLDLTFNRIKKLKVSSFKNYRSIQALLLYENMIMSIEPGTFTHLTSLYEVDLANNALRTIPLELFQLPLLRNLYIYTNDLTNLSHDLKSLEKPIRAPLQYLNVADCMLTDIPDLGVLPSLKHINASRNPLTELTLDSFARMCSLTSTDLTFTQMDDCTCQQVNQHFIYTGVKMQFVPVCKVISGDDCPSPLNQTVRTAVYAQCESIPVKAKVTRIWLTVAACAGGVLLLIAAVTCCIYRRRRRKRRAKAAKAAKAAQKHLVISPKNAINNRDADNRLLKRDEV